jgi:hypothetical protein
VLGREPARFCPVADETRRNVIPATINVTKKEEVFILPFAVNTKIRAKRKE